MVTESPVTSPWGTLVVIVAVLFDHVAALIARVL
jgi:hypothetical protein